MYFRCLLPVAVEMLFMSTASGSRVGFHIYCHFLVAVEVAVEVAVAFQSGSRKESGSRKVNDPFSNMNFLCTVRQGSTDLKIGPQTSRKH